MLTSAGAAGKAATKGLLTPRPVSVAAVHLVGKEGNRLEEVATGEVTDPDEVLVDYGSDEWEAVVLQMLRGATVTEIARRAGMDRAGLSDYLRLRSPRIPPIKVQTRLSAIAAQLVEDRSVRGCAMPDCQGWARPMPSLTCSERHARACQQDSIG